MPTTTPVAFRGQRGTLDSRPALRGVEPHPLKAFGCQCLRAVRATLGEGNRVTGKPRTENEECGEDSLPVLGFPVLRLRAMPALGVLPMSSRRNPTESPVTRVFAVADRVVSLSVVETQWSLRHHNVGSRTRGYGRSFPTASRRSARNKNLAPRRNSCPGNRSLSQFCRQS